MKALSPMTRSTGNVTTAPGFGIVVFAKP